MTYAPRTRRAALLAGALVLSACPGDDAPAQSTTGESTGTSTGLEPTTVTPPVSTTAEVSSTEASSTEASSSGLDPDTTAGATAESTAATGETTAGDGTGTTGGSSSSGSETEGETGTGEQGYGDCFNQPAMDACLAGEICIDEGGMPPGVGVCALQGCGGAGECPSPPPGGSAATACMDVTGDMVDECVLQCSGGAECPTGMTCFAELVCVWAPGVGPGDFSCADQDLGAMVGGQVAMGSTVGQGNDFAPGCVMSSAPDVQLVWTALVGGTYTFDTVGSGYDTVLYALEDCVGAELACNDDTVMTQSQITLDLVAGQSVLLVIDGWSNSAGNYVLNIQ